MNVGVIGLGKMGKLHMMNCMHLEGVEVVSVADRSKKSLKFAESLGVRDLYTDHHDLLNHSRNLDAVVISLPNYLHFESVVTALEAGLNVFVEKPLAITTEECDKIVKSIESSGTKLMVGHCMRFMSVVKKMEEALEMGNIGKLEVVTIEEILNGPFAHGMLPKPVPDWWFDPKKTGGGALIDLGYHWIDLFRFFAGDSDVIFSCLKHKFNLSVEDGAIVILESGNPSSKGIINVGWYQKSVFPSYDFRLILHGSAGYLSSEDYVPRNIYLHALKEGTKNLFRRIAGRKIHPLSYTYYYESYYKEIEHFFECIREDLTPSVSAYDGLETMKLVEKAYHVASQSS